MVNSTYSSQKISARGNKVMGVEKKTNQIKVEQQQCDQIGRSVPTKSTLDWPMLGSF